MEVSERSMGHMAPTVRYLEFWLDDKKINEAPIMREEFVDGEWNWN
jgi:hypothetical protein